MVMRLRPGVSVTRDPEGHHATYSTPVSLRPYRPGVEPTCSVASVPERRGRPPKWPARRIADAVCSTYCAPAAPDGSCPGSIHLGKLSTTTFKNGAWTTGCAKP